MEFLETLESIRAESASVQNLFGGEGTGMRRARQRQDPRYKVRLAGVAKFLSEVLDGRRPATHLAEALTTDDFPQLFGDILDRSVLAAYQEWPPIWPALAKRATVRDFRLAKLFLPNFGADTRLDQIKEQSEYPEAVVTEQTPLTYSVNKFGRRMAFSWETMLNDDLDQLRDTPERFGRAARRTESRFVTELYVDASGPHATLYSNTNKNLINTTNGASANNPAFSIAALQDAYKVLLRQVDESGEPIQLDMVTLVYPPALEVLVQNVLKATTIEITDAAGGGVPDATSTGGRRLLVANWMTSRLQPVMDPYIPLTATTANGNTSWFLFANPSTLRPALQIAFLRGHEEPEVFMKTPNASRVGGGGMIDPMDGDFDTDTIQYKVRHVLGGLRIDPKATVASNGSGS